MNDFSTVRGLSGLKRPQISTVLVGMLILVGGFWIYNNFTKSIETPAEDIKFEQNSADQSKIGGSVAGEKVEPGIGGGTEAAEKWIARDIAKDTLRDQSNYTVQDGDTLWEIAEGRYGSGFEWGRILSANKDRIGSLPDGSQALIQPGDVLVLP